MPLFVWQTKQFLSNARRKPEWKRPTEQSPTKIAIHRQNVDGTPGATDCGLNEWPLLDANAGLSRTYRRFADSGLQGGDISTPRRFSSASGSANVLLKG
jgi:hypothetical protein